MNIGFVSTRFSGTDGVTLETSKWARVFQRNGCKTYWFAGELDRDPAVSYLAPEAHFQDRLNVRIDAAVTGHSTRPPEITDLIHQQCRILKKHLYRFMRRFGIDLIVAENVLSLPMQIPLGLALTEIIAETGMPAIAHHHDFSWERERYLAHAAADCLQTAFPPKLPGIAHVVINTTAREELARRTGIAATVAPNVLDFARPPEVDWDAVVSFRHHAGLKPDDTVILQPTRVVQRKGIEHAVNLVRALQRPGCKLVISHPAGDEGFEYAHWIEAYARSQQVDLVFVDAKIDDPWGAHARRYPQFSLADVYPCASFVTYPSLCEGFGNGLLEAVYFKKPVLVNRYATFIRDIEPLGFDMVYINGFLTESAVRQVAGLLDDPGKRRDVTAGNYRIARRYFSYEILQEKLNQAMAELPGTRFKSIMAGERPFSGHGLRPVGSRQSGAGDIHRASACN